MPGGSADLDVARLAGLARLTLDPAEQLLYRHQLAEILAFAGQVLAVDTAGVPPTTHALTPALAERDDVTRPSLAQDTALDLAPDRSPDTGHIRVPRVIDR